MKKDESLKTFSDINCSNIFLDLPPKANDKKKISKWDLIKVKGFCIAKETIYKMEKKKTLQIGRKKLQMMHPIWG